MQYKVILLYWMISFERKSKNNFYKSSTTTNEISVFSDFFSSKTFRMKCCFAALLIGKNAPQ